MARLFLVGNSEAFELLSELGSHLGYGEMHRWDELPAGFGSELRLDLDDHVVVGDSDPKRCRALLTQVLAAGDAGYLGLCASERETLVSLLKLSADRVPKARLDRISAPLATVTGNADGKGGPVTPAEQAIAVAADLVAARRRRN